MDLNLILLIFLLVLCLVLVLTNFRTYRKNNQLRWEAEKKSSEIESVQNEVQQKEKELLELSRLAQKQDEELRSIREEKSETQAQLAAQHSARSLLEEQLSELKQKNLRLEDQNERLDRQNSIYQTKLQNYEEKLTHQKKEVDEMGQHLKKEFRLLADEITKQNSRDFNEQSGKRLNELLNPFKEKLEGLRKKVEETHTVDKAERLSLKSEIERLSKMNERLSTEADELVKALKGSSKTQGNWGEMILETILQHSGLEENVHYFREETLRDHQGQTLTNEHGQKMRPDVLIKYPDGRTIILDSKVSLNAYVRFSEAADQEVQEKELKAHVDAIKNHIKQLSAKNYEDYAAAPDFVMMFIPIEPAFHFALQFDKELWNFAWEKQIILMSPTNLIAALRLVSEIWKRDKQNTNAIDIADRAGSLYDKFVGVYESMEQIGKYIDQARGAYDQAQSRLKDGRGSVLRQVEQLKELGAKAKKSLPENTES